MVKAHPALLRKVQFNERSGCGVPAFRLHRIVRSASGRVKVWTHERAARRAHESHEAQASANPIYILAAITLGIPALLLIPLIGMNPGVQEGTFTTVVTFLVVSAFVTAVVFEIKRLADQPSDANHH
jgi:hypothetical protein